MNLIKIRHGNETEGLLLSITKNCDRLIKEFHEIGEETLDFKLTKPKEAFPFKTPISIERPGMIGLKSLGVYNFFLIKQKEKAKSNFIQILLMMNFHLLN